jgi:hypothetical protein
MKMSEIVRDAVRYPFSDWKKIIVLGFIILVSGATSFFLRSPLNTVTAFIILIGFLISFFALGYEFRIIKSTFKGGKSLPKFNSWPGMFKDGFKIYLVHLVYLIPIFFLFSIFSSNFFNSNFFLSVIKSPSSLAMFLVGLKVIILFIIEGKLFIHLWSSIVGFIIILYLFIIIPVQYIGIANMVKNNSKLSKAFSLQEIISKATKNGLNNLIKWYIAFFIPFLFLMVLNQMFYIGNSYQTTGNVIVTLTIGSYLMMYVYRLLALYYIS